MEKEIYKCSGVNRKNTQVQTTKMEVNILPKAMLLKLEKEVNSLLTTTYTFRYSVFLPINKKSMCQFHLNQMPV